jgi:hypothetical protein
LENCKESLVAYVLEHGDSLDFTRYFWKGCEPLESDVVQYHKFTTVLTKMSNGSRATDVATELWINHNSVHKWKNLEQMPKLGHSLKAFLNLGVPPEKRVWLTLEHTHGHAIPIGQFVHVPPTIGCWPDVDSVLPQLKPSVIDGNSFGRQYLFGFLLGIILVDAHKPKQGHGHRHVDLTLSKRYDTNQKIGDFTCFCANQLGLRMVRVKDKPKPPDKPHGFYNWASQSSPLVDWIFQACLGLHDGQNTTYDQVHLDWALDSPLEFRTGLLQGIAESDGSVAIASQIVEFWVLPDWDFMIKFLATFGLHGFRNREAVSLVKTQAIESFKIPVFSEHLQTVRYEKLKLMATTRKLTKEDRLPEEVRSEIQRLAREGHSVPQIVEEIARSQKLLVSFEAAQRWAMKAVGENGGGLGLDEVVDTYE